MLIIVAVLVGHALAVEALLSRSRRRTLLAGIGILLLVSLVATRLPGHLDHQKIAARWFMPAGVVAQLLWFGAVWDLRRRRWPRAILSVVTVLFFFGVSASAVGGRLVTALESQALPRGTTSSTVALDAIFVLGGGTKRAPDGEVELGPSGDRLRLAAALYHEGRTARLVASGRSYADGRDLAAETVTIWRQMGIPRTAVLTVNDPLNTSQEMRALAELARRKAWTHIGIVSSAWHLPRAVALAKRAGIDHPVPLAADHLSGPQRFPVARDWMPGAAGLRQTEVWAWEQIGRAVGR